MNLEDSNSELLAVRYVEYIIVVEVKSNHGNKEYYIRVER